MVARKANDLIKRGAKPSDIAVLYRTNAQSRVLEEAFVRAGIPYSVYGGQKFYERKEVKDLIAYMRALVNPDDDVSCRRIINSPKRGIGERERRRAGELRFGEWNAAFNPLRWMWKMRR